LMVLVHLGVLSRQENSCVLFLVSFYATRSEDSRFTAGYGLEKEIAARWQHMQA
jgi:hypothetical protein